jgi:hypothetical protein
LAGLAARIRALDQYWKAARLAAWGVIVCLTLPLLAFCAKACEGISVVASQLLTTVLKINPLVNFIVTISLIRMAISISANNSVLKVSKLH